MGNPLNPSRIDVPQLLREAGLRPKKSLGQNFLIDPVYLARIVDTASINRQDRVLEIGAGVGNLTIMLAEKAEKINAVEIDENLIPILEDVCAGIPGIKVIHGDILKLSLEELMSSPGYLVVANIPYYITSNLIRKLLTSAAYPSIVVLTIQKEVAERICASSGKLNLLALSVQVFGSPKIISTVPAGAFYPKPEVDSAIVKITRHHHPLIPEEQLEAFFRLSKAGFSQKRKTLRNSLSASLALSKASTEQLIEAAGIDPNERAEKLTLEEWEKLSSEYQESIIASKSNNK